MDAALSELREAIRGGRCVFVVGTGVSSAVTGGDERASWPGLLAAGVEFAATTRSVEATWADEQRAALKAATTAEDYLNLASEIVSSLGGTSSPDFSAWLRRDVGYLEAKNPGLIKAIESFGIPIVTTNYDPLLEKVTGRDYVTWQDAGQFQRAISGQSQDIAHLHGFWRVSESIVLTTDQYELMMADTQAETLRQSMAAVNSLIFLGFGEGLSDPNFTKLRSWISETLDFQEIRHYRLCLESQRAALMSEEELHNGRVLPVVYGSEYSDLEAFLKELHLLAPAGVMRHDTTRNALTLLEEEVRESAVLSPYVRDSAGATVADLLIPPVLLPMAYSQYVAGPA